MKKEAGFYATIESHGGIIVEKLLVIDNRLTESQMLMVIGEIKKEIEVQHVQTFVMEGSDKHDHATIRSKVDQYLSEDLRHIRTVRSGSGRHVWLLVLPIQKIQSIVK